MSTVVRERFAPGGGEPECNPPEAETPSSSSNYSVERLPNGLTRVFCRASKLVACFDSDGTFRHGDLGRWRGTSNGDGSDYLTLDETLEWTDDLWAKKRGARASVTGTVRAGGDGRCSRHLRFSRHVTPEGRACSVHVVHVFVHKVYD